MEATELFRAAWAGLRPLGHRCSRSARTHAGGVFSSRPSTPGPTTPCSTWRPEQRPVALELARQKDCYVVGVDITPEMLAEARRRVTLAAATRKIRLQQADARALPFDDGTFDAVTFTYLLRYVDDPPATLRELVRVVKPRRDGLESRVRPAARAVAATLGAVDTCRPADCGPRDRRRLARGRARFSTPRSPSSTLRWPPTEQLAAWREAGIDDVATRRLSLGGGVVTWGRKKRA